MADAFAMRALVSADLSAFQRELARGPRIARAFSAGVSREAARALSTTPTVNLAAFQASGTQAGRGFAAGLEREVSGARPFEGLVTQARAMGVTLAAAFGVRAVVGAADEYTNLANRLRLIEGSASGAARSYAALFGVAQDTRADLGATVNLYSRLAQSTRELGTTQAELRTATTAINQMFAVSGASAEESRGAIVQFGQALSSGVLRGDEFNSISEAAPRLRDAIAESMGVSIGELRALAEAGELTSARILRAVLDAAPKVSGEFQAMATTIGQAGTQFRNAATNFVGGAGESSGAAQALAGTLSTAARNFDTLATVAVTAGVAMGARTFGPLIQQAGALAIAQGRIVVSSGATTRAAAAEAVAAHAAAVAQADLARQTLTGATVQLRNAQATGLATGNYRAARAAALLLRDANIQLAAANGAVTSTARTASAATIATGTGARAAAAGMTLFRGAVGLLGGPVGIGIIALTGLVLWFQRQKQAAEEARKALDEYKGTLVGLGEQEIKVKIEPAQAELRSLEAQADALRKSLVIDPAVARANAAAGIIDVDALRVGRELATVTAQITAQRAKVTALAESYNGLFAGQAKGFQTAGQVADEDVARLAKLRDAGNASAAVLAKINGLVSEYRAEIATLRQTPDLDVRGQDRLILLQERIDALTKTAKPVVDVGLKLHDKAMQELQSSARAAIQRLDLSLNVDVAPAGSGAYGAALDGLLVQQGRLSAEIAKQGGMLTADVAIVNAYADAAERVRDAFTFDLPKVTQSLIDPAALKPPPGSLDALGAEIRAIQTRANVADFFKDAPAAKAAADEMTQAVLRLRAATAGLSPEQVEKFLREWNLSGTAKDTDKLGDNLRALTMTARGIGQLGDVFGGISDGARNAIDGVTGLLDGISQIQSASKAAAETGGSLFSSFGNFAAGIPGMVAAIGGVASLLGGLFGKSAAQKENEEMLRRNNEALADLRASLDRSTQSLGGRAEIGKDVARALSAGLFARANNLTADPTTKGNKQGAEFIDAELRKMGTTLAQVDAVAKDLGITIRDSRGYFNFQAVQQFVEHLGLSTQALTTFTQSFADQRAVQDLLNEVRDITVTPARALADASSIFANLAPDIYNSIFRGADQSTAAGRAVINDRLTDFVERVLTPGFSLGSQWAKDLLAASGFADIEEFRDAVLGVDSALDDVADALTAFASDLSGQRAAQDFYNSIFDVDLTGAQGAATKWDQEMAQLAKFAPDIAAAFAGLDVTTAAGRAAAEAMTRQWAQAVLAGEITAEQLGAFANVGDLTTVILGADSALDQFAESARAATSQMLNVPQGFKQAAAEWAARLPEIPRALTAPQPVVAAPLPYTAPRLPNTPPPGHSMTPAERPPEVHYHFAAGSIAVDARTRTGEELLEEVTRAARTKATALGGHRTRAYEAIQ